MNKFHMALDSQEEHIYFNTMSIFDRYLTQCSDEALTLDYQLIGATSMLIVSKYFEVDPICLEFYLQQRIFKKYSMDQFNKLELEIC